LLRLTIRLSGMNIVSQGEDVPPHLLGYFPLVSRITTLVKLGKELQAHHTHFDPDGDGVPTCDAVLKRRRVVKGLRLLGSKTNAGNACCNEEITRLQQIL
jgi:hypothetical protein